MIKDKKFFVFDLDNTLIDSLALIKDANNHVRRHYGLREFTDEEILDLTLLSAKEMYEQVYGDNAEEALKLVYDFFAKNRHSYTKPFEKSTEFLTFVHEKGIKMGIVTNKRGFVAREEVDSFGWTKFFTSIIGAGDTEKGKPDTQPLLKCVTDMGFSNDDVKNGLYFGDSDSDIECSYNLGMQMVHIKNAAVKNPSKMHYDNIILKEKDISTLLITLKGYF